jgi:hypothetical protein
VSIAGNIGHIQPQPGHPVILADRLTAATSPIAAFAGLSVGLLVLKMIRQHAYVRAQEPRIATALVLAPPLPAPATAAGAQTSNPAAHLRWPVDVTRYRGGTGPRPGLLRDATKIYQDAAAHGERLSQRTLAKQLRGHGHRFPNDHLRLIADSIGLTASKAAHHTHQNADALARKESDGERGALGIRHRRRS